MWALEGTEPALLTGPVRYADVTWLKYNGIRIKEYRVKPPEGFFRTLKTMDDYAAVFLDGPADWGDRGSGKEATLYCDVFYASEYLYSLRRNEYRHSASFHLEFVKVDDQVRFLFNFRHGQLSVVDAKTGRELHEEALADRFFTKLTRDGSILLVDAWIWQPMSIVLLYDIDELARTPGYRPFEISCCEYDGGPEDWPQYAIHEGRLYAVDEETGKRIGDALESAAVLAEERANREYVREWISERTEASDRIKSWYRRKKA